MELKDSHGRRFESLRISVTGRCNLACQYCRPGKFPPTGSVESTLSFGEITRLANIFAGLGVRSVRLTGGEPLLRKGLEDLVAVLKQIPGLDEVTLTTNGILLPLFARPLRSAGLDRINLSLDSLRPGTFEILTGAPSLPQVLAGLQSIQQAGFTNTRLNAVVMRGINDDQLCDLTRFAHQVGALMRFIEFMPIGVEKTFWDQHFVSAAEMIDHLQPLLSGGVTVVLGGAGPARYLPLRDGGQVGIISGVSRPFCRTCNRLRLTAAGGLRLCLASPLEVDLRGPLRRGASDEEISCIIVGAVWHKPAGAEYDRSVSMCAVGG